MLFKLPSKFQTTKESNNIQEIEAYKHHVFLKTMVILGLVIAVVLIGVYSCTLSGREMSMMDGFEAIWARITGDIPAQGTSDWLDYYMVWEVNMPRVLYGLIAGAGLAVCGALMQGVMNNPLADPYTVGVSSAAVFGAVLAIVLGVSVIPEIGHMAVIGNAFLFGLIPIAVIMLISKMSQRMSPVVIILVGIAISYFFGGITTVIMVGAEDDALADAYRWQIGSLESMYWEDIPLTLIVTIVGSIFAMLTYNKLNAMAAGDTVASTLGMDVKRYRMLTLIVVTFIAATIISFTGVIGFVGLVAPHMIRVILGGNNRFLIPASMLAGAAILMFADMISRALTTIDVPVGAVMSLIGAPIFLWLILTKKGRRVY